MLKVENICKTYDEKKVLNNLSFTVPEGEIYTLVGDFGVGKSTLLSIIAGYEKPDSGQVYIKGTDCQLSVEKARSLFGYVPDSFPMYKNMTLKEYMIFFGYMMGESDDEKLKHLTVNLLGFVGLSDYIDKRIKVLNYGQEQKLSIARALLHNPKFIILDEPFYGLNVDQVIEIKDIIEFLHEQGRTIFMTSDNLQLSASLSTSIGIMENGTMLYGERIKQAYDKIRANSRQIFTQEKYNEEYVDNKYNKDDTYKELDNIQEISNLDMTGSISDVNMTGSMPNLDMIGSISDMNMTGSVPNLDVTGGIPNLDMTGGVPNLDMTGGVPNLDMTGSIPNLDMTGSIPNLNMTGNIPNMSDYITDLDITSNQNVSAYMTQDENYLSRMLYEEPIQMPYEEYEAITKTKNGEDISSRVINKNNGNNEKEKEGYYDARRTISRRGIEEKRGIGGSRVVTDRNRYNKPR